MCVWIVSLKKCLDYLLMSWWDSLSQDIVLVIGSTVKTLLTQIPLLPFTRWDLEQVTGPVCASFPNCKMLVVMKPTSHGFCKVKMTSCMESVWQCLAYSNHSINYCYCYLLHIDSISLWAIYFCSPIWTPKPTTKPISIHTHFACSTNYSLLYLTEISSVSFLQIK